VDAEVPELNILALDLGTRTGWALRENGRIESGVQVFDVKRGESPGMRWLRFDRWLDDMLRDVSLVVCEAVLGRFARGQAQTYVASNFLGRVEGRCAQAVIEHTTVPSGTLKKFVTGSGRGDKRQMFEACMRRGWWPKATASDADCDPDDNEVDARCLLHYALAELVPAEGGRARVVTRGER
jgi:crossover junction endodeoxyribonuclease RuvC